MEEIDLLVIGGGTGGYTAAIRAAQLGLTAAIVEADKVGGTCLHRGCIPTKTWLHSAEVLTQTRNAATFGVETAEPSLDYPAMRARQQAVVDTLHKSIRSVIGKHKIEIIEGRGAIVSPNEVAVGDRRIRAKHIVIATGSRPKGLPGLDLDGDRVVTSDELLEREEAPKSIAIIGGGAIGCEFASFFADIGSEVTLIEALPTLVPLEDGDAGKAVAKAFAARGVSVMTSAKALTERTRSYDSIVEVTVEHDGAEKQLQAEILLLAVGREAVTDGLGLENTKVEIEGGWVKVDETYRTAEPSVYAIGDAIGGLLLAHVADIVSEAALGRFLQASAWEMGTSIHPHPSLSEVLGEAAQLSAGISIYW